VADSENTRLGRFLELPRRSASLVAYFQTNSTQKDSRKALRLLVRFSRLAKGDENSVLVASRLRNIMGWLAAGVKASKTEDDDEHEDEGFMLIPSDQDA
jgi:hypothetical protein